MSWILSLVEPHIVLNLTSHKNAKDMRAYLKSIYFQENSFKRFHLESKTGKYTQADKSIQEYYFRFMGQWT